MTTESQIPYTKEAILNYLKVLLPKDDTDLENWIKEKFEEYEYKHRKLPETITVNTLIFKWVQDYKYRGHSSTCRNVRVIRSGRVLS
jgi:hypothetical protein